MKALRILALIFLLSLIGLTPCWAAKSKNKIMNIHIVGIEDKPLQNVKQSLNANFKIYGNTPDPQQIKYFINQVPTITTNALKPYGYFRPQISVQSAQKNQQWHLTLYIIPGQQIRWNHVDFKITGPGVNDPDFQEYQKQFEIKPGLAFSSIHYQKEKQELYDIANDHGYFNAKMISHIEINPDKNTADLTLHFATGPRATIGTISISPTPLKESFIKKYLAIKSGQPYSAKHIETSMKNLREGGYFNNVSITPDINHAKNNIVPIHINLKPKKSQEYVLGAGFGTDTGPRALIGVKLNHITDTGQYLDTFIRASQTRSYVQAKYVIPGTNPITDQYQLTSTAGYLNQVTGTANIQKVAGAYLTTIFGWQQTLALTLQRESSEILNGPKMRQILLVPSIDWQKIIADHKINPQHGWKFDLGLQGASSDVLAKESFFESQLQIKTVQQLTKNIRVVSRANVAQLTAQDIFQVPLSFQLFAGGAESIRGYSYQGIGPGEYLYTGSFELQHRLYKQFYVGAFMDAGNSNDRIFSRFNKGTGLGLIWLSPIGSIEFSVAQALDVAKKPWRIHFAMGPEL